MNGELERPQEGQIAPISLMLPGGNISPIPVNGGERQFAVL
jgi:hypothetical protein